MIINCPALNVSWHTQNKNSSWSCDCQQNWPQFIQRCQHLSHLIGPDETVLANHICPFMPPPTSSRGRLWRSATPCWTAPGTHPTGAGIREQIWIFYFWFIKVIIYFFIVPLPMCVGKCFVFYMPPSPPPPPKYITCKEIQRHSVWEVKRITQYYLS